MIELLVVAACGFLNRLAGGGWPSAPGRWWDHLTGRVACGVWLALVALLLQPWPVAVTLGAGFVFWRIFSWGWLIGAIADGHEPIARPTPSPVEGTLLKMFGPYLGMTIRMLFILPALLVVSKLTGDPLVGFLAFPFAVLATLAYVVTWRLLPHRIFQISEVWVGMLWGVLIILI